MIEPFTWHDGARTIAFGRGRLADAGEVLGDRYLLLTTPRAARAAPAVEAAAAMRVDVRSGQVDEIAGELLDEVPRPRAGRIVALGGGRVIDAAKALASGWEEEDPGWAGRVAAIPTTLSAAEMTDGHRQAPGRSGPFVRPDHRAQRPGAVGLPAGGGAGRERAQRARARVRGPDDRRRQPVATVVAHEAVAPADRRVGSPPTPATTTATRSRSARCSRATRSTRPGSGCTTCWRRRSCGSPASATGRPTRSMLPPHDARAGPPPTPSAWRLLAAAVGEDPATLAAALAARTGATRLRDAGVAEEQLATLRRRGRRAPPARATPPPADRAELLALYEEAW